MFNAFGLVGEQKRYIILVGKNGSGKSSLLYELSEQMHDLGYNVVAVSNTLFDKFKTHPYSYQYYYIGNKLGRNFPAQAIKKTLATNNDKKVNRIFDVLNHIGYDERIGVNIKFRKKFVDAIQYQLNTAGDFYPIFFDESEQNIPDELKAAIDKAIHKIRQGYNISVWLTANDNVFFESDFKSYLLMLEHERFLKKAKIISGIEIHLSKDNFTFPISGASSGELSFIALLVHIAFCNTNKSYIFIDEPENSLHPQWQNEYLELLKGAVGYNECKVVIATHSPLIITSMSKDDEAVVYKKTLNGFDIVKSHDDSTEELYIDYFDTLTPKNRALSNRCVGIIDEFNENSITFDSANVRLNEYEEMATDSSQKEFLLGVKELLLKVAINKG